MLAGRRYIWNIFAFCRCDARFLQLKYDVPSFETAAEFLALVKAAATLSNDKKRSKGGTKGGSRTFDGTFGWD